MTEIHDQSYRRYRGERTARSHAWTVIATAGIRSMLKKRVFLGLLLAAWGQFFFRAVQAYLAANFPQTESILGVTAATFRAFLDRQSLFVFFVTIYVGAGLIANDRRSNALQIYLSKPLTRTEYIAGKLAILVVFLLLITWVPALLLLVVQAVFQGTFAFARANLFLVPAITVFSFLQVLLAGFTMLALSSLSKSSRYAGVLYAGAVLFSDATFNVLRFITGNSGLSWISFPASLEQIGNLIFRLPPKYDTPWAVSVIAVLGVITVSISILERRVRGVEVVT